MFADDGIAHVLFISLFLRVIPAAGSIFGTLKQQRACRTARCLKLALGLERPREVVVRLTEHPEAPRWLVWRATVGTQWQVSAGGRSLKLLQLAALRCPQMPAAAINAGHSGPRSAQNLSDRCKTQTAEQILGLVQSHPHRFTKCRSEGSSQPPTDARLLSYCQYFVALITAGLVWSEFK